RRGGRRAGYCRDTRPMKVGFARRLERLTRAERPVPEGDAPIVPIGELSVEDVVVVGYPKSGNTWFQILLAGAVFGVDTTVAPPGLVSQLVPDLQSRRSYRRLTTPMFFKSHDLPRPEFRRVVQLLRDGRDVMVSYVHHLRAIRGEEHVDPLTLVEQGKG